MRIGIDLGGTKIEIVALDDQGDVRARRRVATPAGNYPATIETIATLVAEIETRLGCRTSVGVGIPGSPSPADARVRNANSLCLNGQAIERQLSARLDRPVRVANDANCFAISEATDGAGAGAKVVFGVILGTGVGGGIVVEGRLLEGRNRIAGEWGHNPLPPPDALDPHPRPQCWCGRSGCIETLLSGPGMADEHRRLGGGRLSAAQIVAAASDGDPLCEATMARYERRLARALAGVINLLDPEVIVLGGGLSRIARLYRHVPELWVEAVFSDVVGTRLLPARHGDASGVRGAAWLWPAGENA
jgi:fructokinase